MTADFGMRFLERNTSPLPNNTGGSILCKEDIWQGSLQPGKQKHFNSVWKSGIKNIIYDKFRGLPSKTDVCIRLEWRLRMPRRLPLTGSRLCQTLRLWVFKVEIILQSVWRHSLYPKLQPTRWKSIRANAAMRHRRNWISHFNLTTDEGRHAALTEGKRKKRTPTRSARLGSAAPGAARAGSPPRRRR